MVASGPTHGKLARLARELSSEFANLPREDVEQTLFAAAEELLARAHFQDYVPLLAHRHALDRLRTQAAHPYTLAPVDGTRTGHVELISR
jgi:hypothetical protein